MEVEALVSQTWEILRGPAWKTMQLKMGQDRNGTWNTSPKRSHEQEHKRMKTRPVWRGRSAVSGRRTP